MRNLFTPFKLNDLTLSNRVVMAPLTRARSGPDRIPNQKMATYYSQRASAGLLITEATVISPQGIGWAETPGIYNDAQVEGWRRVTEAVHQAGSKIFLQLWHTGRAGHSDFLGGELPVAPSAVAIQGEGIHTPEGKKPHETPRPLATEEVARVVEDYRLAARRARQAGFDGVEIHAANGYLIDQFLQSKTNHRDDQYGGDIVNRFRFLDEVVTAVSQEWPKERIGVRLSPNGNYHDMGSPDFRETFFYAVGRLNGRVGYLHVIDGLAFGFHQLGEPITLADARQVFDGVVIGSTGYTRETANAAIQAGQADLIAFGRDFISNPDLVERFAKGWPLNPPAPVESWYTPGDAGYIDFPAYRET
ncbi:MAG: alkene reductase, partial [Candidatus Eremiobacteraeota bacterium]|nr:alkene reductase [Candidatus Eremiobacteraeota bacterium]